MFVNSVFQGLNLRLLQTLQFRYFEQSRIMEHGQLPPNGTLEGHQGLNRPYWMHQSHRANHSSGNRKVPVDCHGDTGESAVDDLLDRSGLFDELVCQILDESSPNTEAGIQNADIQQNQHFDSANKDQFQGLHIRTSTDAVSSAWAKTKAERGHESSVYPRFPPGITERPEHPALFSEMYPGPPASDGQQGNMTTATGSHLQQPIAGDTENKRMQEYFHSTHFMKGENLEGPEFKANFPEKSLQGVLPNSGGDCRNIVFPNSENQYGASKLNLTSQSMGSRGGQDGARDTPATEDPHQYFRQRASAAQQAQQFSRQGRAAQQFPMNEQQQAMNLPFANQDAKTHLMQMNMANNWTNFNNLLTKGNLNLRTNTVAFDPNQFQRNMNTSNPFGQNQVPNYQFSLQRMSSPHQAPGRHPSQSQKTSSSGGHFQNQIFPLRPQIHNQSGSPNMPFWQQSQQYQQNDQNQNYLGQLHVHLEECYYQFYSMEKERKKTEIELARLNPGRRISSANTIQTPQLPDNPTSLDRLIVDFYKEHSRVSTLMSKIGGLCGDAVHPHIDAYLENWVEAIQEVRRREELLRLGSGRRHQDDKEEVAEHKGSVLVDVIQKLALATRSSRTALWCALQMSKENLSLQSD